jgi:hypothetical protein
MMQDGVGNFALPTPCFLKINESPVDNVHLRSSRTRRRPARLIP